MKRHHTELFLFIYVLRHAAFFYSKEENRQNECEKMDRTCHRAGRFALSAVVSLLLAVFDTMGNDGKMQFGLNDTQEETVLEEGNSSRKIAVLEVNGTISDNGGASGLFSSEGYNHRSFLQMLEKAKDDSAVKGIILRVNSPGGGVYESAEIHKKLEEIKKDTKNRFTYQWARWLHLEAITFQRLPTKSLQRRTR